MAAEHPADDSTSKSSSFKKFCRACTDFKTWAKQNASRADKNQSRDGTRVIEETKLSVSEEPGIHRRQDCPLDRDELGRNTWSFLHTMAAYYPDVPLPSQQKDMDRFIQLFAQFYPCDVCAEDMRNKLKTLPPQAGSQSELSQWLCRLHNSVNNRLGKPEFDCSLVNQRWKDGWKDGSCD